MSALHPKNEKEAKAFEQEGVKSQLGQYVDVQERVVNEMKKDGKTDKEQLEREMTNLRSLQKEQELLEKSNQNASYSNYNTVMLSMMLSLSRVYRCYTKDTVKHVGFDALKFFNSVVGGNLATCVSGVPLGGTGKYTFAEEKLNSEKNKQVVRIE